jgi:hypothetical protein
VNVSGQLVPYRRPLDVSGEFTPIIGGIGSLHSGTYTVRAYEYDINIHVIDIASTTITLPCPPPYSPLEYYNIYEECPVGMVLSKPFDRSNPCVPIVFQYYGGPDKFT